jgi:hypothetical protein
MERSVVTAGGDAAFNLGVFDVQRDLTLDENDQRWFIRLTPDDEEQKASRQKKKEIAEGEKGRRRIYEKKRDPNQEWLLFSDSEKYFRERIHNQESNFFFVQELGNGNYEVFCIKEEHIFKPTTKPPNMQTPEEQEIIVRLDSS